MDSSVMPHVTFGNRWQRKRPVITSSLYTAKSHSDNTSAADVVISSGVFSHFLSVQPQRQRQRRAHTQHRPEREEHVVPAPLVCPEGESAVLSGAPGRPRPDRRDRARGLRRSNRRFGGLVLSGVHRPGTSLLSARRRRSAEPKELGERSPVSQPHLHLTSRQRPRTTLPRS